jgi:hypothetical protein
MPRFTADCSRCCGLCCFVPAYLKVQGFPFDKPAARPCRHLTGSGSCGIHARRIEAGFGACASFDCHGAGQWITQQLCGGRRWQDSPATARAMASAWQRWLPRFECAALLEAALPLVDRQQVAALQARIDELLDPDRGAGLPAHPRRLRDETLAFIRARLPGRPSTASCKLD